MCHPVTLQMADPLMQAFKLTNGKNEAESTNQIYNRHQVHIEMFIFQAFHVRLSGINGFYIHEICIKQVLQITDLL